jgi:DNA replication protein DnaC
MGIMFLARPARVNLIWPKPSDKPLPLTVAEDLLQIIMRRYERASTLLTSNRPVEDWGKLLADVAAVTAMLDRILHHGQVLKCGPRSWRTKTAAATSGGNQ